jgi:hypothetical protein
VKPTPVVITTDLDQTLIFSPRATTRLGGDLPTKVVETLDGHTVSEMALDAIAALDSLGEHVELVPTTTRTPRQLARISLPRVGRYQIAANGGVVLVDGAPDQGWAQRLERARAQSAPLSEAHLILDRLGEPAWLLRRYDALGLFTYAIVAPDELAPEQVDAIEAQCGEIGWQLSLQGRKLYLLPAGLTKQAATEHVLERITDELGCRPRHFAAGDTGLDRPMLEAAELAWIPRDSDLDRRGGCSDHVTVTTGPGHLAAREITQAWLALTTSSVT